LWNLKEDREMSGTVMPPTPEIESAGTLLEESIGRLLKTLYASPVSGRYEADVESVNLLKLVIRHVESVVALASRDLVLLPSALAVTRAAFETSVKLLWMATPNDPFQREVNWLVHMKSEEDYYMRVASQLARFGADEAWQEAAGRIKRFRLHVTDALPEGYALPKALPNVYEMLASLGEERRYIAYRTLCQYAHGTHFASGLYRKHLGPPRDIGEYFTPEDWWPCFAVSWYSLHTSGRRLLEIAGGNVTDFLSAEHIRKLQDAIAAIGRQ
jgi:hypothetical protein